MKRNNFTLTELLVSIVIIVILAAILVPTVASAIGKAEVAKAKTGITTLVNAIKQYESTYHKLPLPDGYEENDIIGNGGSSDTSYKRYKWLIELLQGQESLSNSSTFGTQAKKNPRKMQFLDIQGNNPGEFLDPWDNNYRIILDKSYSGKLTNPEIPGVSKSGWKKSGSDYYLYYDIVVWSIGSDGEFKAGTNADELKDSSNEDNIYSFNTGWDKNAGHVVQR